MCSYTRICVWRYLNTYMSKTKMSGVKVKHGGGEKREENIITGSQMKIDKTYCYSHTEKVVIQ